MSEMTVKDFAAKVGRDVPRLLEQMKEAGLEHKSEATPFPKRTNASCSITSPRATAVVARGRRTASP